MNAPATARLNVRWAADVTRGSALALSGLLVSMAVILGWRRAAGAIAVPLDLAGLLLTALLVATCAAGARLAWLSAAGDRSAGRVSPGGHAGPAAAWLSASRVDIAYAALVSMVVLAIGLLVCLPGTTLAGGLALGIVLGVEELFAWRLVVSPGGHAGRVLSGIAAGLPSSAAGVSGGELTSLGPDVGRIANPSGTEADLPDGLPIRPPGTPKPVLSPLVSPAVPGAEVLQQLTRSRTADGGELLSGWLRVDLTAGQRTANLHVAFCPPFVRAPRISVQQVDGPESRIKTVQTLPYGVRFDLKLADEGQEASTLLLQFAAAVSAEAG